MLTEMLIDQRNQVEEQLCRAIPDTEEYNELFRQLNEINTELVFQEAPCNA